MCLLLVVAASVALAAFAFDPRPETWDDNAEFLVLAESLSTGQGYAMVNDPRPWPNTRLLPAWPAMLALARLAGASDLFSLKLFVSLLFVLAHVFLFLLLSHHCQPVPALAGSLWSASHFLVLPMASQTMSETAFVLLSLAVLWILESPAPVQGPRFALVALLTWLAVMTRGFGVALAGTAAVALLVRGSRRGAVVLLALVVAGYLPWMIRGRMAGSLTYEGYFLLRDPYRPEAGSLDAAGLVHRMATNAGLLAHPTVPFAITGWTTTAALWLALAALAGAFALFACRAFRARSACPVYPLLYLAILLAWPTTWCKARMIVPLIPLVPVVLLVPWGRAASPRASRVGVALAVLLACMIPGNLRLLEIAAFGRPDRPFAQFTNLAIWARDHLPPDAVVACRRPYTFYVVSGRHTLLPREPTLEETLVALDRSKATHLVETRLGVPREAELGMLVRARPARFRRVQGFGDQVLHEIVRPAAPRSP